MNQDPTSVLVLKATPYQATNGLALILMNVQVILELLPVDNLIIVSTLEEVCKGAFCIFDQSNCTTWQVYKKVVSWYAGKLKMALAKSNLKVV